MKGTEDSSLLMIRVLLIIVFGVPPYVHEDDANRAIKTAMEIRDQISDKFVTMGIATGNVYNVYVGSVQRGRRMLL